MQYINLKNVTIQNKTNLIVFNFKKFTACKNLPVPSFHYLVSYLIYVMDLATMVISSLGQYNITAINQK